ncbi:hypothetical protein MPTK1_3g11170 [Marchantia polymorpha subsp. ruderalis]|uniref:Uncharacterized protein n=2 Tax=Marchantia polymorpha TaxID=3197 RepID=A0AAF6AZL7_MARPO|nr:hypothetical protein MARPO_0037s0080 [Marchantia polymorpha]BBN05201.1 hypothetical protein Mp_3g11170 [Marchantia polymorpha subsp. ruderalis]|eukprot:PTQ40904.1 hypothetical protein MARPO_0037s0080 [Marchantia polymorpha]
MINLDQKCFFLRLGWAGLGLARGSSRVLAKSGYPRLVEDGELTRKSTSTLLHQMLPVGAFLHALVKHEHEGRCVKPKRLKQM